MPATIMAAGTDYLRDIYLMPRDTRISNGTFEKNSDYSFGLESRGSLPVVVSSEAFATGHLSVRLGQSTVSQNKEIAQNAGTASLSQTVTIPPAMQQPTLSYMVWAAGAPPTAGSGLRVLIQADSQSLPVETNKLAAADWTLNWIDMSPWQGQQVTITFEIVQNAGDPPKPTIWTTSVLAPSIPNSGLASLPVRAPRCLARLSRSASIMATVVPLLPRTPLLSSPFRLNWPSSPPHRPTQSRTMFCAGMLGRSRRTARPTGSRLN